MQGFSRTFSPDHVNPSTPAVFCNVDALTNTCRCRFCGNLVPYMAVDAGREINCTRCGQRIKLPGHLAKLATVQRGRTRDPIGNAMEIGGFVLMFLFFPWGLIAGAILLAVGWRKTTGWTCSQCKARLKSRWLEACPKCRTKFTAD
jgi:DNA-directed RNA polymerase subunit RPC12/RpoP